MKLILAFAFFGLTLVEAIDICSFRPAPGPCKASILRFYFDGATETCKEFIYGGCQGNANNFKSKEDCHATCVPKPENAVERSNEVCSSLPEAGLCKAYLERYYYDETSGECKTFIYGGCGGNSNNFLTKDDCHNTCGAQKAEVEVCSLEHETGPCRAYIPRYYFDTKSGECKKFIYGGCQGNGNNFKSMDECHDTCSAQKSDVDVCSLEKQTGPCLAYFRRFYFDAKSGECKEFVYGGCQGNGNNFRSLEECHDSCGAKTQKAVGKSDEVCSSLPETGRCKAYLERFYYDETSGECKTFVYGGCGGNGNNFLSKDDCHSNCGKQKSDVEVCSLEHETGPCRAAFPRYYFDSNSGECKIFIYGGCQGNGNNFLTKDECHNSCGKQKSDVEVCSLEHETGPCRAAFPRYYFDSKSGECKKFIYGGCQGNGNNFKSIDECHDVCAPKTKKSAPKSAEVCKFLPETGLCKAYIPRFYYDEGTNECKEFIYGGCGGNSNNFVTKEKCHNTCHQQRSAFEVCRAERETGPCKAYIPRWYYDRSSQVCKEFIYGGCGGNANNFASHKDCHNLCEP